MILKTRSLSVCLIGILLLPSCVVIVDSGIDKQKSKPQPSVEASKSSGESNQWRALFNGKDLSGWTPKFAGHEAGINYLNTFRVEDQKLIVDYERYEDFVGSPFGHLITNVPYQNYHLKVEYRFVGEQVTDDPALSWAYRNNGLMLHSQSASSMQLDQAFPMSVEAQLLGGNGEVPRTTGNVCTPLTHIIQNGKLIKKHCISSSSATFHGDQWVTFEAKVFESGRVEHFINGDLVFEYDQLIVDTSDSAAEKIIDSMQLDQSSGVFYLNKGHIAIQAESHPTEFRMISIKPL